MAFLLKLLLSILWGANGYGWGAPDSCICLFMACLVCTVGSCWVERPLSPVGVGHILSEFQGFWDACYLRPNGCLLW